VNAITVVTEVKREAKREKKGKKGSYCGIRFVVLQKRLLLDVVKAA